MQKTSKVKKLIGINARTHPQNQKVIFFHKMEMENGETISLGKQKENAFKVGDEIVYTETEKDGKKLYKEYREPYKPAGGGMSDRQIAALCASKMIKEGEKFTELADKILSYLSI